MSRPRWWERPGFSIEREVRAFEEEGLAFTLDQGRLDHDATATFRGELRLGDRRHPAAVLYPPAYDQGAQAQVRAPGLPIDRHIGPDGFLCLDHPVLGEIERMNGAEAVLRAERLWWLWENDRDQLAKEEADAPDPRANHIWYEDESAIVFSHIDVGDGRCGVLRLGLAKVRPGRGGVHGLRVDEPDRGELELERSNGLFVGGFAVRGVWWRLDERPPGGDVDVIGSWLQSEHQDLVDKAVRLAAIDRQFRKQPKLPALAGFVYTDEGPGRGEEHDAWLLALIDPDGSVRLPRPVLIRPEEQFLRQPGLAAMADRRVVLVGAGALGSPIAAQLARAGLGGIVVVDHDVYDAGNRIRHDLDLLDAGKSKAVACCQRVARINPTCDLVALRARYGMESQAVDDEVEECFQACDLIIDATAHKATGFHIAAAGRAASVPVLRTWVSAGARGARVLVQRSESGCYECFGCWQDTHPERVPEWSEDPTPVEVMERGCADPTFTGTGFDLAAAAAAASRVAVAELVDDADAYPGFEGDLLTLAFREEGVALPTSTATELPIHPDCSICAPD